MVMSLLLGAPLRTERARDFRIIKVSTIAASIPLSST